MSLLECQGLVKSRARVTPLAGNLCQTARPIEPGQSATLSAQIVGFPALQIQVYAAVDPDSAIPECNDGNNSAAASALVSCTIN